LQDIECDLILADVMMPEMGGLEWITELEERGCDIPVVLMSGCSDRRIDASQHCLAKPFTREALREAVGRADIKSDRA